MSFFGSSGWFLVMADMMPRRLNVNLTDLPAELLAERPHLFSSTTVSVSAVDLARMCEIIAAIERVIALPQWREKVGAGGTALTGAAACMGTAMSVAGVFMGYDFHLTPAGPKLIEINTNAGGGLLAALQAGRRDVLETYVENFRKECFVGNLKTIAIVDDAPQSQFLYPEFLGFRQLFEEHGIRTVICAPADLMLCHGSLWCDEDTRIDLVYNRLTDFDLGEPAHVVLREAWRQGGAVITPNPDLHALYADKRNLIALTDDALLAGWDVDTKTRDLLAEGIPRTELVMPMRAEDFWQRRRQLFFKPALGYGSKGSYRGDKLTKRVFEEILSGDYVAQAFAPPSVVAAQDGEFKLDLRNYVYRGAVQLVAARLYQGQTTNFRTPGGGFAKVIDA
jgi:hypothetical protein